MTTLGGSASPPREHPTTDIAVVIADSSTKLCIKERNIPFILTIRRSSGQFQFLDVCSRGGIQCGATPGGWGLGRPKGGGDGADSLATERARDNTIAGRSK